MADYREMDYLLALLSLEAPSAQDIFPKSMPEKIEEEGRELATEERVDSTLDLHRRETVLMTEDLPTNFLDLYTSKFYDRCSLCKKMGYLSQCLLCGETFCTRTCLKSQDVESTSSLP